MVKVTDTLPIELPEEGAPKPPRWPDLVLSVPHRWMENARACRPSVSQLGLQKALRILRFINVPDTVSIRYLGS